MRSERIKRGDLGHNDGKTERREVECIGRATAKRREIRDRSRER